MPFALCWGRPRDRSRPPSGCVNKSVGPIHSGRVEDLGGFPVRGRPLPGEGRKDYSRLSRNNLSKAPSRLSTIMDPSFQHVDHKSIKFLYTYECVASNCKDFNGPIGLSKLFFCFTLSNLHYCGLAFSFLFFPPTYCHLCNVRQCQGRAR